MRKRKSKAPIIILLILTIGIFCGGILSFYHFDGEVEAYERTIEDSKLFFQSHVSRPFINRAANAVPHVYQNHRDDALFFFEAPEGFAMISHSAPWNQEMLELLYHELMLNEHGKEMDLLYEVIIYPYDEEEERIAATYTPGVKSISFFIDFPAFPEDFSIEFPQDIGTITLYNGDMNTTVKSMASSLSHEYGHLYTFYYMFNTVAEESGSLKETEYARLRDAARFDLITNVSPGDSYWHERHRYLIEVAAEDYVQLMGSPTTRQVIDYLDVQQILNGADAPESWTGERNAFPQENMMIPLANDVPGLADYFYSYIDSSPRIPIEEKMDITLQIQQRPVQHNLIEGLRTFTHYTITWNAPYQNAIYTLICYDPDLYAGWGFPVKTVHPGQNTSAVIGEYVIVNGDRVTFMDDNKAQGTKVFCVVALLPDGTFYLSEKLEYNFD